MISEYLSGEGYNTITATSGSEALKMAETHRPFAVTLDVVMPDMDGWEVLQNLKKNPETADIPVIIVSVSDDRETGFALGAVGSITKPFTRDTLIAEIGKIGRAKPHSIMVVDDNEIDLKEMARVIEDEGIKAVLAGSGSKCLEMLKEHLPDVLVLDLMMPEMDGFEVLERIRIDPETGNLPVIIVTAKDLTIEDRKRLEWSVSSILAKSDTTSKALLEEIKKILMTIERNVESQKDRGAEKGSRILLVEDNESSVIQVRSTLESEGFIVDVACNGQEALDYVKDTIPAGIILDLMMPGVDGFEVLEKIRSTEATAGIPVLILTAKDLTPDDFKRLKSNNVRQLLQKGDVDRNGLLLKTKIMMGLTPKVKPESADEKTRASEPARRKETKQATKGKKGVSTILVVEDNPDNMITIKAILKDRYEILGATDGEAGLQTALDELPDLVLLDISLPKMDGFEVVGKIKADERARQIPVLALTARAMKGDREQIMEAGCDDYISKPVDPEEISKKVDEWLGKN
jgi:CheY-like chemotaxis protein